MTLRYKTDAIVIRKEDNLESSRMFSVFTKDFGRIKVLGRGIRKIDSKLRGGIEIFSLSDIEFIQGVNKKTLTDAVFIKKFNNIFKSTHVLEVAHKISQLAEEFITGEEPDEKIWNLLVDSFDKLNQYQLRAEHCQLIYSYFFWNFVLILGYEPELSSCASCSTKLNPYELYFSNKEGGVICKNCYAQKRDALKIKSDTVKILRLILKKDWDTLSKLRVESNTQKALKKVSDGYCAYLSNNISNEYKSI